MISEHQHRSKQLKIIIGMAVLLLLLVGSSIFFLVDDADGNGPKLHSGGTTTATTSIRTPPSSLTPQPLFFDNFVDNKHGWYTSDTAEYTRMISNNTLTLSATNHKLLTESVPASTTFDDFMITATFTLTKADAQDSVGLYLRGDSYLDHDYRIEVFGNTSYAVSKEWLDATHNVAISYLVSPTPASALKPLGQENTLKIIMEGSNLMLLINGTLVNSLVDSDYTRGQIALFVNNGTTSDGVTAVFSSIVIYPVPDQPGK